MTNNQINYHEEIDYQEEFILCKRDIFYFIEKYLKIENNKFGILIPEDLKLYDYQKNMLNTFDKNDKTIVLACRQSGKTITPLIYLLHLAIFNDNKTCATMTYKLPIACQLLEITQEIIKNLPIFLRPVIKKVTKTQIHFEHNSSIIFGSTPNAFLGYNISCLVIDEMAFNDNQEVIYNYINTIHKNSKKIIVTSTPRGDDDMFYVMWQDTKQCKNDFKPFIVDWQDVPGRDEEWKRSQIAYTSQKMFDREFGNTFV